MGRVSEELKDLKKREEKKERSPEARLAKKKLKVIKKTPTWPVKDVDYYIVKVEAPNWAPRGWIISTYGENIHKEDMKVYLDPKHAAVYKERPAIQQKRGFQYFVYKGEKPNPDWGELCP